MIATEDELQVAREAAAEVAYYRTYAGAGPVLPWRDLDEDTQVRFRALVESLVAAALGALPDRAVGARHLARAELARELGVRIPVDRVPPEDRLPVPGGNCQRGAHAECLFRAGCPCPCHDGATV